jgi:hypothetical protein
MSASVCAADTEMRSRAVHWHGWRANGGDPQATFPQCAGECNGGFIVTDDQRLDRGQRWQQFHRQRRQAIAQLADAGHQTGAQRVTLLDQMQARRQRAGDGRRLGGGEDVAAALLQQVFDGRFGAGDEGAADTSRLAQRAHEQDARRRRQVEMARLPLPCGPRTPKPCASSITSQAS